MSDIVIRLRSPHFAASNALCCEAADEIERLRAHIRSAHRLNGYSKSKGWWCSCGQWWASFNHNGHDAVARPWDRRQDATAEHDTHVAKCCGTAL